MSELFEIGGYFELERNSGSLLHDNAIALNCGRGCLRYLIEARTIEEVWLPDYMCGALADTCAEMGVKVHTYTISEFFEPVWDFEVAANQWLYLGDFYGQLSDECVKRAREISGGRLVVDETQGYFSMPRNGVDTLYTCRKYFGVPDGGFLYTDSILPRGIPKDVSYQRMSQVLGRFELGSAMFLDAARRNNDDVGAVGLRGMSALTENMLRGIDYRVAREKREDNYAVLHKALGGINPLSLRDVPGPFAYPLLVNDGPAARSRLAKRGVFVAMLWPEVAESASRGSVARRFARDILPLPVDQRYGRNDMQYILKCLQEGKVV